MNNIIAAIGSEYVLQSINTPDSMLLNYMLIDEDAPAYTLVREETQIPSHSGGSVSINRSPNHPEY